MNPLQLRWTALVLPLLASIAMAVGAFISAPKQQPRGAERTRLILLVITAGWLLCKTLEILSISFDTKLLFSTISYIELALVPTTMLVHAAQYANPNGRLSRRRIALIITPGLMFSLLALTNGWHGLIWTSATLDPTTIPPTLRKDFAAGFIFFMCFVMLSLAASFGILLRALGRAPQVHSRHIRALILSSIILIASVTIHRVNLGNGVQLDLEPYALLLSALVMSHTIVVVRDSDVIPAAREIVIEQFPDPILMISTTGTLIAHNTAAKQLFETRPTKSSTLETCLPNLIQKLDFSASDERTFEVALCRDNGDDAPIYSVRASPICDSQGNTVSQVISMRDITTERRIERERQSRHRYLQTLWKALPDAVVVVDSKGFVQEWNAEAETLLSHNLQEALGACLFSLIDLERAVQETILSWLANACDGAILPQMQVHLEGGSSRPLDLVMSGSLVIPEDTLRAAILVFTDATQLFQIERQIRAANEQLEARVADRTSELVEANRKLAMEIAKHQRVSSSLRKRNRELLSLQSAVAATGSSLDLAFILETVAWEMVDLLGVAGCTVYEWQRDRNQIVAVADSLGRISTITAPERRLDLAVCPEHYRTLQERYAQTLEPDEIAPSCISCEPSVAGGRRTLLPMVFQGQSLGLVTVTSQPDGRKLTDRDISLGQLLANQAAVAIEHAHLYSRAQHEITERERIEQQLRTSLREKETLLQEIHHRVKNNLQVISSLLSLQSHTVSDPLTVKALQDSQNRLRSMSLIHERLYRSDNLAHIDFGEYLRNLTSYLVRSYRTACGPVAVSYHVADVHLNIEKAVPCGLIVNELLSNALKYAFPDGNPGKIEIGLTRSDGHLQLTVSDNGIGLPEDMDIEKLDSLGLQLVHMLTDQLNGEVQITTPPGTTYDISFRA